MQETENKARFLEICKKIERPGIEQLLEWLDSSDFYTAPASTKFHGAYAGGLLEHSLNVYDEFRKLLSVYKLPCSEETCAVITLFHDLCKVNAYTIEKRSRKNETGQWESYNAYTFNEKLCYGGHGSKSVFIIQNYMKLTAEEAVAVNCHMGCWDGDVGKSYGQFPLAWLLHVADEAATYLTEGGEKDGTR